MVANPGVTVDFEQYFAPIADEAEALDLAHMAIAREEKKIHKSNWKILVEGGLESYHFKVAHRKTIGPYFEDNLSSYQMLGDHMRSVLMRSPHTLKNSLRRNGVCAIMPTSFTPSSHNTAVGSARPYCLDQLAPCFHDRDRTSLMTLCRHLGLRTTVLGEEPSHYPNTLNEDFYWRKYSAGLATGANEQMTFGRFEGALPEFNRVVKRYTSLS